MNVQKKKKNPAAVELGRLGGKRSSELLGVAHYQHMARLAHISKVERYGNSEFYRLVRAGYKPREMTAAERRAALAEIDARQAEKRKTQ